MEEWLKRTCYDVIHGSGSYEREKAEGYASVAKRRAHTEKIKLLAKGVARDRLMRYRDSGISATDVTMRRALDKRIRDLDKEIQGVERLERISRRVASHAENISSGLSRQSISKVMVGLASVSQGIYGDRAAIQVGDSAHSLNKAERSALEMDKIILEDPIDVSDEVYGDELEGEGYSEVPSAMSSRGEEKVDLGKLFA